MLLHALRQRNIIRKTERKLLSLENNSSIDLKNKPNSVLVLIDNLGAEECKKITAENLNISIHNVEVLIFKNKKDNEQQTQENIISVNDFGWFGKIKRESVRDLINQNFDLLLNYTIGNVYLNYITSITKAAFKVGFSQDDARLYDLIINIKEPDIEVFNSELEKYLKILIKK